jgi:hypothetical protein
MFRRTLSVLAAFAALLALTGVADAQRLRVGTLECRSPGSTSFIVGSVTQFRCTYFAANGPREFYTGVIRRVGLDLGYTGATRLVWVVTAASRPGPRALAGVYAGVSAGVALGLGGGANVLVGGFRNSITLQPLSFQGERGVNLSLTVSGLELR